MSDKARVSPAADAQRREARALRDWVETRAQYVEDLARAIAEQRAHVSREEVEARARHAGIEAKAYADQGLHLHASALRALGRAVADLTRQNRKLMRDRDALAARLAKCEAEIDRIAGRGSAEAGALAGPDPAPRGPDPAASGEGAKTFQLAARKSAS